MKINLPHMEIPIAEYAIIRPFTDLKWDEVPFFKSVNGQYFEN